MKVRDLKKYIGVDISVLGQAVNDPWMNKLQGDDKNLESVISLITDFAVNSATQLFYELLQNAEDEESTRIAFKCTSEGLWAVNNGKPFYTDLKESDGRKGQLKKFLEPPSGSYKFNDKEKIGNKGRGSKVLYDLLGSSEGERSPSLKRAVYDEHKGPILCSWNNEQSINSLRSWSIKEPFEVQKDNIADDILLVTKIVYTYYPATLGETRRTVSADSDVSLFTKEELVVCTKVLLDWDINWLDFKRGTLLFIPFGEGKYEEVLSKLEDKSVITGISTSLALLNNLKEININGERAIKPSFDRFDLVTKRPDKAETIKFRLFIPSDEAAYESEYYNFFQFFPVTSTKFNFKFILDSNDYAIDAPRQNINYGTEGERNIRQMAARIAELLEEQSKEKDSTSFIKILKSLLRSEPQIQSAESKFLEEVLYENLLSKLKTVIPTENTGIASTADKVRIKKTALDLTPKAMGISNWDWLDSSLEGYEELVKDKLEVQEANVQDILTISQDWVLHLNRVDYSTLLLELEGATKFKKESLKYIRTSDNKSVCSITELEDSPEMLFIYNDIAELVSVFDKVGIVHGGKELLAAGSFLGTKAKMPKEYLDKVIALINGKASFLNRDDKWLIFNILSKINVSEDGKDELYLKIRSELKIFKNINNEFKPLAELLPPANRYVTGLLLEPLTIKADENYAGDFQNYFLQKLEIWDYCLNNWDVLVANRLPSLNYETAISDLNTIFEFATQPTVFIQKPKAGNTHNWIRNTNGEFSSAGETYFNDNLSKINSENYGLILSFVESCTTLNLISFEDLKTIESAKFATKPNIKNDNLKERWEADEYAINEAQIKALDSIQQSPNTFLSTFLLTEKEGNLYISNKESGAVQYWSKDTALIEFLDGQEKASYYLLPSKLEPFFKEDHSLRREGDEFLTELMLIKKHGAQEAFISMVVKSDSYDLQRKYIGQIENLNIDTSLDVLPIFEEKVFRIIQLKGWEKDYRDKITINQKPLKQFVFKNEITIKVDTKAIKFSITNILPGKFDETTGALLKAESMFRDKKLSNKLFDKAELGEYDSFDLYSELKLITTYINHNQFAFEICYLKSNKILDIRLSEQLFNQIDEIETLDLLAEKEIIFYSEYRTPSNWIKPSSYFYSSEDKKHLLLEEEKVPAYILEWIESDPKKRKKRLDFLAAAGLRMQDNPILKVRSAIETNKAIEGDDKIKIELEGLEWHEATLNWALGRDWCNSIQKGARYELLCKLIAKQGAMDIVLSLNGDLSRCLVKKQLQNFGHVSSTSSNDDIWKTIIAEKNNWQFIDNYKLSDTQKASLRGEIKITESFDETRAEAVPEWKNTSYDKWKESDGKGYTIKLTDSEIPIKCEVKQENTLLSSYERSSGNKKTVKTPAGKILYIYTGSEDFMGFFLNNQIEFEDEEKLVLFKLIARLYSSPNAGVADSGSTGSLVNGNGNVTVAEDLQEIAQKVVNNLTPEAMIELAKRSKEDLEKLFRHKETDNEESTANELIGFIGEQIAMKWLEARNLSPEYVADKEHAYDIKLPADGRFIDVKTTIKPLVENDKSVPIHLHQNTMSFLEKNPDCNFYIIMLSLSDLGLLEKYDVLNSEFVQSEKVLTKELKERIKNLADAFWADRDNQAKCEQTSMEFKLNIPKIS